MEKNLLTYDYIDLRGLPCPINFVKCCLALEKLSLNQLLKVDLDLGEAETNVIDGLQDKGYTVKVLMKDPKKVTLIISSEQL